MARTLIQQSRTVGHTILEGFFQYKKRYHQPLRTVKVLKALDYNCVKITITIIGFTEL